MVGGAEKEDGESKDKEWPRVFPRHMTDPKLNVLPMNVAKRTQKPHLADKTALSAFPYFMEAPKPESSQNITKKLSQRF